MTFFFGKINGFWDKINIFFEKIIKINMLQVVYNLSYFLFKNRDKNSLK